MLERLLCRTEGGRVGRCAAKHAHHVGQGHIAKQGGEECHGGAEPHHAEGEQVELCAAREEGAHKAGTHLQAEGVDK